MAEHPTNGDTLLERAAAGDARAWGMVLSEHTERLRRMVGFRLDRRLHRRIDAADVVQEAFVEAAAHRDDFFRQPGGNVFLWLRAITANKLLELHRHHLGTRMRDAARDVALAHRAGGDTTSDAVALQLTVGGTGPFTAAGRAEMQSWVRRALGSMDAIDREVLALRHFEQLTNGEAAQVLGIAERAAAKRYVRALQRLKSILSEMPGGKPGIIP